MTLPCANPLECPSPLLLAALSLPTNSPPPCVTLPAAGWFCCTKPLSSRVKLLVQHPGSEAWEEVHLGSEIRALVVLNLQS